MLPLSGSFRSLLFSIKELNQIQLASGTGGCISNSSDDLFSFAGEYIQVDALNKASIVAECQTKMFAQPVFPFTRHLPFAIFDFYVVYRLTEQWCGSVTLFPSVSSFEIPCPPQPVGH